MAIKFNFIYKIAVHVLLTNDLYNKLIFVSKLLIKNTIKKQKVKTSIIDPFDIE